MALAPHPQQLADLETPGHKQSAVLVEKLVQPPEGP